jgi:hypothetical protein
MKNKWLLIVGVLVLVFTVGWVGRGQVNAPDNVKWEYLRVYADASQMSELNRVGAAGWELVTVACEANNPQCFYVFKRRK